MGKYSLIVIAGFVVTFGWIRANLNEVNALFSDNFLEYYDRTVSRLSATSAAQMALAALSDSLSWRAGYADLSIGDGTGWATLEDSSTDTTLDADEVRITAGGSSGESADTVEVLVSLPSVPPGVHGGVTANSTVHTLGGLIIDGRDHDLNGNLIAGTGTMGVSTKQTFDQGGSSTGGGTAAGVDYSPSDPANPAVIEENAAYDFPASPDSVFGYASGALKAMAQSGANGGQYVTDPANLTFPLSLSGVTYVELASGETWQSMDFGSSSGVLVVHNSAGNAAIKNLNSGTFKGLIIADDIEKIHATLIGAVVSLTTTPSGNCIGNGNGEIRYSSTALIQAASVAAGGGGGVTVLSWLE
ncbi:MAG: hypothetical protein HYW07_20705 [Candidatus Latescibacteria bacterium]|nr:hypothetical protein [Candidatus Latescibacterota bacterium]